MADSKIQSLVEAGIDGVVEELQELEQLILELALSADKIVEAVPAAACGIEQ